MKIKPESIEVNLEDGRKIFIYDTFITLWDERKGFPQTTNIQLEELFSFAE